MQAKPLDICIDSVYTKNKNDRHPAAATKTRERDNTMKHEIKNIADLIIEVNFTGHMLHRYGLKAGTEIETELGTGKAIGVSHIYHNREAFDHSMGQVDHMITVELENGTEYRVDVSRALGSWVRVNEAEFSRWMRANEQGRIYRRVGIRWDEANVAALY